MDKNCVGCTHYVDCRIRARGMKKVKQNHSTNRREDIRIRIAMMQHIAEQCVMYEKGV